MPVLLLDGDTKHALAVTRSLGKHGIEAHVGAPSRLRNYAGFSRYCRRRVTYPPLEKTGEFIASLANTLKTGGYEVTLPLKTPCAPIVCKHKAELEPFTRLVLPDYSMMRIASNKRLTFQFLDAKGFPAPKTYFFESIEELTAAADGLNYPVVIKKALGSGGIYFANSPRELIECFSRFSEPGTGPEEPAQPIIQEYIPGEGFGFFALYNRGKPRAIFMHHRLKEYPVTGGPSVMAASFYDEALETLGLSVLTALNWHGVAMVEVKKDSRDGKYKIMEINPKFWGSLDLAIASGVDFPLLTYRLAMDGDVTPVFDYRVGLKFRWLIPGELLRLFALPGETGIFFKDFFRPPCAYDFDFRDPLPHLLQLGQIFAYFVKFKGRMRYPWGRPLFNSRDSSRG